MKAGKTEFKKDLTTEILFAKNPVFTSLIETTAYLIS